ncbi:hypothetical protein NC653_027204 [Populus alba x Populus x berolinensis]|uniref:Uncharacterized protein n=1 Tax=Populus alba x Populus x berolinensis TaxID=444605 RepID=A0AAD6M4T3_9ROSI|nr:hypothetical protein NC653_027204 [Populus alba x Populus x berolinensis]
MRRLIVEDEDQTFQSVCHGRRSLMHSRSIHFQSHPSLTKMAGLPNSLLDHCYRTIFYVLFFSRINGMQSSLFNLTVLLTEIFLLIYL